MLHTIINILDSITAVLFQILFVTFIAIFALSGVIAALYFQTAQALLLYALVIPVGVFAFWVARGRAR